jgi:hypothetical protein
LGILPFFIYSYNSSFPVATPKPFLFVTKLNNIAPKLNISTLMQLIIPPPSSICGGLNPFVPPP